MRKNSKKTEDSSVKSISLFGDESDDNKNIKKRQSKTSKSVNNQAIIKSKKSSQETKETKKSVSIKQKTTKKDDNRKFHIDNSSRSTSSNLDDSNDSKISQTKKRTPKGVKGQSDSLEKPKRATKTTSKPKEDKSRNIKQFDKNSDNSKPKPKSDARVKTKRTSKQPVETEKPPKSEKQRNIINITKTRLEKERKRFRQSIIGSQVQLNESPKKTDDEFLVEINLSGERILVSSWAVDKSNVYHPGLDSELLVNRFRPEREEEKKDDSLDKLNKELKTKFKSWDEASEYQGKLSEATLTEYADKFNWMILLQSRDMDKYSAKFKKKFSKKYALRAVLDAEIKEEDS